MAEPKKQFTPEFRAEAVRLAQDRRATGSEEACSFPHSPTVVLLRMMPIAHVALARANADDELQPE